MSMEPNLPICWPCGLQMQPEKNGVVVIEMASFGPVALWMADLWQCPECGAETVKVAKGPYAVHYIHPSFAAEVERVRASRWSKEVWINRTEKARGVIADAADPTIVEVKWEEEPMV